MCQPDWQGRDILTRRVKHVDTLMAHVSGDAGGKPHVPFDHQSKINVAVLARIASGTAAVKPRFRDAVSLADTCKEQVEAAPSQEIEFGPAGNVA